MRICVTAAKTILNQLWLLRRSKYEKDSHLRFDFSKVGKVTIYAEFPKKMGIKGQRLDEWPELALPIAREKAAELAADGLKSDSVIHVIVSYKADLAAKVSRYKLGEGIYHTYLCRTKNVKLAFSDREAFSSVTYQRLVKVLMNGLPPNWTITLLHFLQSYAGSGSMLRQFIATVVTWLPAYRMIM